MGTGKHGKHGVAISVLPLGVGAGHVADERTAGTGGAIQKQRQVAGERLAGVLGNQQGETVTLDQFKQRLGIRFIVGGGDVHGNLIEHEDRIKPQSSQRTQRRDFLLLAFSVSSVFSVVNERRRG